MRDISKISGGLSEFDDQLEGKRSRGRLEIVPDTPDLPSPTVVQIGDMNLHVETGDLQRDESTVHLTPSLRELLRMFGKYPGRVLSRERLEIVLYGDECRQPSTLNVHIHRLGKSMKEVGSVYCIRSIRGYGHRFQPK